MSTRCTGLPTPWLRARFALLAVMTAALLLSSPASAQQTAAKRPLRHSDYDSWNSIEAPQLSPDGTHLAYGVAPEEGDGQLVVRNLATGAEWRQPRGSRPAPSADPVQAAPPQGARGQGARGQGARGQGPRGSRFAFAADSRTIFYTYEPTKAETDKARKARARPEQMPKGGLGILDLASGKATRVEHVRGFQVPEEGAGYVAYLLDPPVSDRPAAQRSDAPTNGTPAAAGRNRPEYGSTLVLRDLAHESERTFLDVLEYSLSKDARLLVYTVSSKQEDQDGVYVVPTGTTQPPVALLSGKGKYTKLAWDEEQTQLAFLSDRDDAASTRPHFKLYHWTRGTASGQEASLSARAVELVSSATPGLRQDLVLSENAALSFSQDGQRLFFGVAVPRPEEPATDDAATDDKVVVDLWHWKDDFVQPMQKIRARTERDRTFRAVFHLHDKKLTQLTDETMTNVNLTPDGSWALGLDDRPYRILVGYDTTYDDVYLVNTADGQRKSLLHKHQGGVSWSPGGKFALHFDGKDWISVAVPEGKATNLTKNLGVTFVHEDHDTPNPSPAHGVAGWTAGDRHVLLYDHYDLWQVAPDGSEARNLTGGFGRAHKTIFRYVRLDPKEKAIDPARPLLLRAENEATRDSGFYRVRIDGGSPRNLLMAARNFGTPIQAKHADVLLLTASTFNEFPDLFVTDPDFKTLKKVSDANPQKAGLLWGSAELVSFKNADGVPLSGILIKPEDFDPNKKYPMLVYIYEKLSQNLHHFVDPKPGTSVNVSYYASNGYLVFMPDIVYTIGYPGQSALKCVLPGIQAVVDRGFVDEKAIGIQGHSWGGYQIAYMVTQTNRFKAASAGAPVANMTSAYGGIRWGTGLPRQFQYERTQSRIGGSLWQYPMRFVENSPLFQADRVQTPLLMLHNDADDAVPWYQGIEYFLALRRLGKEVYLFNYNGELHGLRKRVNQKDYTVRLHQFFDHHLKGAAKPDWMEKGIPYQPRTPATGRRATVAETEQP